MSPRISVTLLVLAVIALITVQAKDRRADSLFGKTRQQHQQGEAQAGETAAAPGRFTFERRRMTSEETAAAEASKVETGLDADINILKMIKAGTFDFFKDALPDMLDTVTKEEAGLIFENFKFMKTTKAWKAFEATGNADDEEAVSAAMIKSVQEMGKVIIAARPITKDADSVTAVTDEFIQDLKDNDPSSAGLFDAVKSGDAMAIATLQQKFADKYLGGVDLDAFADNEWIERARAKFFANEDLLRLIDDNDVLDILRNPELKLHKASEMGSADPSRLLSSLMSSHVNNHGNGQEAMAGGI
ncbi:Hypothetical protein NocV09_00303550 [Nannochloropsis oceanica]